MYLSRKHYRYIIGVDEVGRGPVAGPVTVGAVVLPSAYDRRFLRGIRDSKQLTSLARTWWYIRAKDAAARGELQYAVSSVGAPIIDRRGIVKAVRTALRRTLARLSVKPRECLVLLDGGLHAPEEYVFQKTIVRGEEREPVIALASIMAKVKRDAKMVRLSGRYPAYGFEMHKGYGTRKHLSCVKRLGPCELHRRSFLRSCP